MSAYRQCIAVFGLVLLLLVSCANDKAGRVDATPVLRHKIGQMLMLGFAGKSLSEATATDIKNDIEQGLIGGVVLFDYDLRHKRYSKNIASPEQVRALTSTLQQLARRYQAPKGIPGTKALPLLISVDYEGGQVNRLKPRYGFPETHAAAKLATFSDELVHHYALQLAETLKRVGFNLNFAPVVDLNTNPDNPVIGKLGRSFGASPDKVAFYASLLADAMHQRGIGCAYKHFPGHGSAMADSHAGFVDVSRLWTPAELMPYRLLLATPNHCPFIMTAHIVNKQLDASGAPATLSKAVLTDLLRGQLGYDGIVITDDMQMKAITDNYTLSEAVVQAINAGADMLIFGNQLVKTPLAAGEVVAIIEAAVNAGHISQARIDEAYHRIVAYKQTLPESV